MSPLKRKWFIAIVMSIAIIAFFVLQRYNSSLSQETPPEPDGRITRLYDKDVAIRIEAIEKFNSPSAEIMEAILIDKLYDQDLNVQRRVVEAIGNKANVNIIPHLIARIRSLAIDSNQQNRTSSAPVVGEGIPLIDYIQLQLVEVMKKIFLRAKIDDRSNAISLLKVVLEDANDNLRVRICAAFAIVENTDDKQQCVPILIEGLQKDKLGEIRGYCAKLLGEIGDKRAITALREALNDPYETHSKKIRIVHDAAERALRELEAK